MDYRALKKKTRPDRHPIPRIQETLDNLGGSSWFSVLDQGKAYHQGFMSAKSQPYTAFITLWGRYEWVRIPFGLSRTPGAFQRSMENCLGDLRDTFLDDVIIFSAHLRSMLNIHAKSCVSCESMELNSNRVSVNCSKEKLYFLDAWLWCLRMATS